ncbi:MAG: hypothetical protein KF709_13715 [Gemmatimonadaceae bacterium]|nr:hypothetical protein [Gemmatimonadaceae bacterium]
MISWRFPRSLLLVAVPLVAAVAACSEKLETSGTCPLLCPGQGIVVQDSAVQPAYAFDTVLTGFPLQGLESPLLLAQFGDTFDVRAVVRFDTLVRQWVPLDGDTLEAITYVDSAFLSLRLYSGGAPIPQQFFVEAFDVFDSTLVDSIPQNLLPLFTDERLLGALRTDSASFVDSSRVRIPLDDAKLLAIIGNVDHKLRIGLRVRSGSGVRLLMTPYFPGGDGPALEYRVSPDTLVRRVAGLEPASLTPAFPLFVAGDYVDYSLVAAAPDISRAGTFRVGGLPGARTYLRFELPLWLTDSVGILRAQLELTQDPVYGVDQDSTSLVAHLVLANNTITDLRRAATLLAGGNLFNNTLRLLPADSGVQVLEMNSLLRQWASVSGNADIPAALLLRSGGEGATAGGLRFFGQNAADPALRPRLRVSYTRNQVFGRP